MQKPTHKATRIDFAVHIDNLLISVNQGLDKAIEFWDSVKAPDANLDFAANEIYFEIWDYLNPTDEVVEFNDNFFATLQRCREFLETDIPYEFSLQKPDKSKIELDVAEWPFPNPQPNKSKGAQLM